MTIYFKEPKLYFYIKTLKIQYQQFNTEFLFRFVLFCFPLELPASFAWGGGTELQHGNTNELHDYQVWKYKTVIYDYLCLISATQESKNANQRQQHLDAIKEKHLLAALKSCIHSEFTYSM